MEPLVHLCFYLTLGLGLCSLMMYIFDMSMATWDLIPRVSHAWLVLLLLCPPLLGLGLHLFPPVVDASAGPREILGAAFLIYCIAAISGAPLVRRWFKTRYQWVVHDTIIHPIYGEPVSFAVRIRGRSPETAHVGITGEALSLFGHRSDPDGYDYASVFELFCAAFHQCYLRGVFTPLEQRGVRTIHCIYGAYHCPFDSQAPDWTFA